MAAVDFTQLTQAELDAVLEGPAMPPPEGEVSIFDDPPNKNGLAIGVFTACNAVVVICLAIRLYAKLGLMRKAQVQEYLIVAAFVSLQRTLSPIRHQTDKFRGALSAGLSVWDTSLTARVISFTHGTLRLAQRSPWAM